MENLPTSFAKFGLNAETSSSAACSRETQPLNCMSSGTAGTMTTSSSSNNSPILASAHTTSWLAALHAHHNNNNNESEKSTISISPSPWPCLSCDSQKFMGNRVNLIEEDEGGGGGGQEKYALASNGAIAVATSASKSSHLDLATSTETDFDAYDLCGAVSLTPPIMEEPFGASAVAASGGLSNRTSLNNSTENLSYVSDNFYGDDVIILGEDGDAEADELSLNSDDCIYAYRGEGADFDISLQPLAGMGGGFGGLNSNNCGDEETDFLEMDFEPDPLSELEYNNQIASLTTTTNLNTNLTNLMQRNSCHLSSPSAQRHQLFSSPIDDLPPPPKALQAQSMLGKNFARVTLHLDQIQRDYNEEPLMNDSRERLNSALDTHSVEKEFAQVSSQEQLKSAAHSLPNTLHQHFANRSVSESAVVNSNTACLLAPPLNSLTQKSPSKVTGAKPKRLSTFSSTSSTSSKNSSKSRNSLRSAFHPTTICSSSSFDERSVSCSEFRTERDLNTTNALPSAPHTAPSTAAVLTAPEFNSLTEDACLDCLEKEFLANTIGKALDSQDCSKCRKRLGSLVLYNRSEHSEFRRSASPTSTFFLSDQASTTCRLFSCEFLHTQARKRQEWDSYVNEKSGNQKHEGKIDKDGGRKETMDDTNQNLKCFDSNKDFRLLKTIKPAEIVCTTIPTVNLNEAILMQALDKLHVSYNKELVQHTFKKLYTQHFNNSSSRTAPLLETSTSAPLTSPTEYRDLLHFLLAASKSRGNYRKLKKIIEKISKQKIIVQFKKDSAITEMETIQVNVTDVLHYWSLYKNLDKLKQLDQRFLNNNVLGKIANIIRQANQRCTARRPLPEFISIPQYYPSGILTLTRAC
uniref:Uncharacterized protein n=1 Tax=Glossina brevipalpis TaxID=37001 RepID=A0A1A9X082_9MUSC